MTTDARSRPVPRRAPRAIRGFTMPEMMVTLAIAAVLAGVAAPSVRDMVARNRLKSHTSALQTSLMLARTEAIKRQVRVVVCKSADQAGCTTAGDWQQGWIVFLDANDSASVDAGETVIERVGALSGSFILQGTGNLANYVSYTGNGSAKVTASDNVQTGRFNLCQTAGGDARQIDVFATGRLSFGKEPAPTCPVT
jgi:type IV fimbrial biogenesis protein FimT